MSPLLKLEPLPPLSYLSDRLNCSRSNASDINPAHSPSSLHPVNMAPNKPSLIPRYTAVPEPGRIRQGEEPIIVIKDAAMIYESHKIFPIKAHNSQYARYQAFSATGTKPVPTIIATSQREIEALDWIKLFENKDSNTDCLARGLRGKGIVKQYEDMRTLGYIFQHMTVPVVSVSCVELKAGTRADMT